MIFITDTVTATLSRILIIINSSEMALKCARNPKLHDNWINKQRYATFNELTISYMTMLCVCYHCMNEATIKFSHPLKRIDDTFDMVSEATLFITHGLKSGYWQGLYKGSWEDCDIDSVLH